MKYEVNVANNEIIVRDMTEEELEQDSKDIQESLKRNLTLEAKAEKKATARQAILDRLGITADEAAILLG